MAVWEYKIISSGKGGFATPALLESFLNQLGSEQWEIVEFRTQSDNALAFAGLARRPTQRDWTLEDAAAAAARAEADKLRAEFEAKFKGSSAVAAAPAAALPEEAPVADDGLRRLRDTDRDLDPDAPDEDGPEDEWDKLGGEDELPTFFEALRPHMRRNQRGPGLSVGVDYLAKKWDLSDEDVIGALKECGLVLPEDEDSKPVYVEYDGDLFWMNINRRGELWINTKEKPRPVFRTVQAARVTPEEEPRTEAAGSPEAGPPDTETPRSQPRRERERDRERDREPGPNPETPSEPLPAGNALLDRIRPLMRRNRRGPGGSGSTSFLSRALKCTEDELVAAFASLGLTPAASPNDKPAFVEIGEYLWWLNKDGRGGLWINAREKSDGEPTAESASPTAGAEGSPPPAVAENGAPLREPPLLSETASANAGPTTAGPAASASTPGHVLAALRLLLKETRTGSLAASVDRLSGELSKTPDDLLAALTGAGLKVPEKAKEKPVFVEHAGEIFWLNRNAKDELWLNAKASKYADGESDGDKANSRPRKKKAFAEG